MIALCCLFSSNKVYFRLIMGLLIHNTSYNLCLFFVFCSVFLSKFTVTVKGLKKNLTPEESLTEDIFLDPVELMIKYGYAAEKLYIVTEDKYILELHHMLQKKHHKNDMKKKHPVFLMHGMASSSYDWLSPGPGKTLPYILHDLGFDVWLGNTRGNIYSRNHVKLNSSNPEFWKFSWHEIGYYDLPAVIDFILRNTSSSGLHYIGHSQGCTTFFVLTSMRPEYNSKILSMNALAPPVLKLNVKNILKIQIFFNKQFAQIATENLNIFELPPLLPMRGPFYYICREQSSLSNICTNVMYYIMGEKKELLNKTLLPLMISHFPAGLSIFELLHYAQLFNTGNFSQYDHGRKENLKIYGSKDPPEYPLKRVTTKVALHYSDNDYVVSIEGVKELRSKLPNVILLRKVPNPNFNHIDFLFAINVTHYVYDSVVNVILKND